MRSAPPSLISASGILRWWWWCLCQLALCRADAVADFRFPPTAAIAAAYERSFLAAARAASAERFAPMSRAESEQRRRLRRQIVYYICGVHPYQKFTTQPCPRCANGGQELDGHECTSAVQCVQYYAGNVACIHGRCCTADEASGAGMPLVFDPSNPNDPYSYPNLFGNGAINPNSIVPNNNNMPFGVASTLIGFCPTGAQSNERCSAAGHCEIAKVCLNGLCCPRTSNDFAYACGGERGIEPCEGGQCRQGLVCTPSNFCCQCPVGRSAGRCEQGGCAAGFRCNVNGYCCSACPNGTTPFGECSGGKACGMGTQCISGDICCFIQPDFTSAGSAALTPTAVAPSSSSSAASVIVVPKASGFPPQLQYVPELTRNPGAPDYTPAAATAPTAFAAGSTVVAAAATAAGVPLAFPTTALLTVVGVAVCVQLVLENGQIFAI